jgi:predicted peroxiredoxin
MDDNIIAEDVIENGVKEVKSVYIRSCLGVGDAIQNGVKDIMWKNQFTTDVQETIQNGVKDVLGWNFNMRQDNVEDTIENGVKHTMWSNDDDDVKDVIKNGVRYTKERKVHFKYLVEDAVQNGVKDIGARHLRINRKVDDAIENGVKEVKTPGNGDLVSTVEWMDENNTYNVPELIDDVIENGVKETYAHPTMDEIEIEDTIQNGVKVIMSGSEWYHQDEVDNLVKNGVK